VSRCRTALFGRPGVGLGCCGLSIHYKDQFTFGFSILESWNYDFYHRSCQPILKIVFAWYMDPATWQILFEFDFIIITGRYLLNIQTLHLAIVTYKYSAYN
jgi:hypothetical protein